MAANDASRHMSLIPYPSANSEVVLRHGDAVVTRDRESQHLTLRNTRTDPIEYSECPYCRRPFEEAPRRFSERRESTSRHRTNGFVNPDYFRMLADRTPVSAASTRPPSPTRPLRALRSGDSRNVSGSGPPTGAEFMGSTPAPRQRDQGIRSSSFLPGYFKQFFVERRVLGKGGRGVVLLVEHVLDGVDCGEFACKRIPVGNDHDWLTKVLVEVQLLQRLHHPNLVAYQHVWLEDAQTTKFGPSVPCVFILQQYCNAGDLHEYVLKPAEESSFEGRKQRKGGLASLVSLASDRRQLSLDEIFSFFKDIVSGLDHLHGKGYIHRDLKPSNCLLHDDGNRLTVLVSDFGEVQAATAQRASTGATGTISYCAPEVLQKERPEGAYGNFTIKSDVFSLGMILHYMCFKDLPYVNADIKEENEDLDLLRTEITSWHGFQGSARRRNDLPDRLYIFLEQLLNVDPAKRPTTTEILTNLRHGIDPNRQPNGKRVEVVDESAASSDGMREHDVEYSDTRRIRRRLSRRDSNKHSISPTMGAMRPSISTPSSPQLAQQDPGRDYSTGTDSGTDLSSHDHYHHSSDGGRRKDSLLLLPPPPPRSGLLRSPLTRNMSARSLLRLSGFLLKVTTLTFGCGPYAHDPKASIPLLLLAALDLLYPANPPTTSFALLVVHIVTVLLLSRAGRLCQDLRSGGWSGHSPAYQTEL